jgi:hypothetical protein
MRTSKFLLLVFIAVCGVASATAGLQFPAIAPNGELLGPLVATPESQGPATIEHFSAVQPFTNAPYEHGLWRIALGGAGSLYSGSFQTGTLPGQMGDGFGDASPASKYEVRNIKSVPVPVPGAAVLAALGLSALTLIRRSRP